MMLCHEALEGGRWDAAEQTATRGIAWGEGLPYGEHLRRTRQTNAAPPGWQGLTGRIDRAMLAERAFARTTRPRSFVCGPTVFVETVASALVDLGHDPLSIRLERFG